MVGVVGDVACHEAHRRLVAIELRPAQNEQSETHGSRCQEDQNREIRYREHCCNAPAHEGVPSQMTFGSLCGNWRESSDEAMVEAYSLVRWKLTCATPRRHFPPSRITDSASLWWKTPSMMPGWLSSSCAAGATMSRSSAWIRGSLWSAQSTARPGMRLWPTSVSRG